MVPRARKVYVLSLANAWYSQQIALPGKGALIPLVNENGAVTTSIRRWQPPGGLSHDERAWALALRETRDIIIKAVCLTRDQAFMAKVAGYALKAEQSGLPEIRAKARSLSEALMAARSVPYPGVRGSHQNGPKVDQFLANVDYVAALRRAKSDTVMKEGLRAVAEAPDVDVRAVSAWFSKIRPIT